MLRDKSLKNIKLACKCLPFLSPLHVLILTTINKCKPQYLTITHRLQNYESLLQCCQTKK